MDQKRPYILASNELCYEANPNLWNLFCALTGRPIGQPNYNWTEQDVIIAMLARGLAKHDIQYIDEHHGAPSSDRPIVSYDIRRERETNTVMAVRPVTHSEDDVLYVIGA